MWLMVFFLTKLGEITRVYFMNRMVYQCVEMV